jgi:hypothetical protein
LTTPERIEQGETYAFAFDISGGDIEAFSGTWKLLQYPGDAATDTGTLTLDDNQFKGVLSSATTQGLAVSDWFIYASLTDTDEDIRDPLKFSVGIAW